MIKMFFPTVRCRQTVESTPLYH